MAAEAASDRGGSSGRTAFAGGTAFVDGRFVRGATVVVDGGRIAEVLPGGGAPAGARVIDCAGATLLPAFGDGHVHAALGGLQAAYAPVVGATSVDEVVAIVRDYAAANPDEPWVRGHSYAPSLAPGGEFDARWLDAAVPDRPVALWASDHHTMWVNSRALQLAGIFAGTPDPADGTIVRRPDGTPMGTLREWGAWRPVARLLDDRRLPEAIESAAATLARLGIAWIQEAWVEESHLDAWIACDVGLRADLALLAEPGGSMAECVRRFAAWRDALRERDATRERGSVTGRTVKFFADGVIEGGTAAMLEPYADSHGLGEGCGCPGSRGQAVWEAGELAAAVTAVSLAGFSPHVHAIGDAGIRMALDAIEAARGARRTADVRESLPWRPVVAHTQLVDPADLPRFAALGAVANFEPLWACLDDDMEALTIPRLGAQRAGRQYPMRSLLDSGAAVSFGSDWPVSSPDPLAGIAVAVTRQTSDGRPPGGWTPHERLTLEEAVAAYTSGVAHQAGADGEWGAIAPGARADLVLVDADLAGCEPLALNDARVVGAWSAGPSV